MTEMIKVQCSKCGAFMKEKARKIRGGYSMTCTHCTGKISFETQSDDSSVRKALSEARRIRRQALAQY